MVGGSLRVLRFLPPLKLVTIVFGFCKRRIIHWLLVGSCSPINILLLVGMSDKIWRKTPLDVISSNHVSSCCLDILSRFWINLFKCVIAMNIKNNVCNQFEIHLFYFRRNTTNCRDICRMYCLGVVIMVFSTTFNNISAISSRSVLLVEETGVPGNKTPTCRKSLTHLIT